MCSSREREPRGSMTTRSVATAGHERKDAPVAAAAAAAAAAARVRDGALGIGGRRYSRGVCGMFHTARPDPVDAQVSGWGGCCDITTTNNPHRFPFVPGPSFTHARVAVDFLCRPLPHLPLFTTTRNPRRLTCFPNLRPRTLSALSFLINEALDAVASHANLRDVAAATGAAACLLARHQTTGFGTMLVVGSPDPRIVARRQELAAALAPGRAMCVTFTIYFLADIRFAATDLMLAFDPTAPRAERYEQAVCAVMNTAMAVFSVAVAVHATPRITFEQRYFLLCRCSIAGTCMQPSRPSRVQPSTRSHPAPLQCNLTDHHPSPPFRRLLNSGDLLYSLGSSHASQLD